MKRRTLIIYSVSSLFLMALLAVILLPRTVSAQTSTPAPKADLVITQIVTSPYNWTGGCAVNLDDIGIRVTVRNAGAAYAPVFYVSVYQGGEAAQNIPNGLEPGESITIWFSNNGPMTVVVDSFNVVDESNETNNSVSYTTITATPPVLCTRTVTPTITLTPLLSPTITATYTPTHRSPTPWATRTITKTPTAATSTPTRTLTPTPTSLGGLPDLTVVSIAQYTYSIPTATANAAGCWPNILYSGTGLRVTIQNTGTVGAGPFMLDLNGIQAAVTGLAAGASASVDFKMNPMTRTATVDATGVIAESNESNNTLTTVSNLTATRTGTARPPLCYTGTPTPTNGPSLTVSRTPTRTPTPTATCPCMPLTPTRTHTPTLTATTSPTAPSGGMCSPVTGTITAPFSYDGAGALCWQSSNLGTYINSWNTSSVTVNTVNYTNVYANVASLPAKINGYWYVTYNSMVAWAHFEAK